MKGKLSSPPDAAACTKEQDQVPDQKKDVFDTTLLAVRPARCVHTGRPRTHPDGWHATVPKRKQGVDMTPTPSFDGQHDEIDAQAPG